MMCGILRAVKSACVCLPKSVYITTVLSKDQIACSSSLKNMVFRKSLYKRRAGQICEAEVLKALMSLAEYETPLGDNNGHL